MCRFSLTFILALSVLTLGACRAGVGMSFEDTSVSEGQLAASDAPASSDGIAARETVRPAIAPATDASPSDLDAAMRRGITFLVGYQNENGSWGSPTRTKSLNIYAPVPGGHDAFRGATTALCIAALVDTAPEDPQVIAALNRAEQWLLEELPKVRRADGRAIYNNWAHAYGIQAAVRLLNWGEQTPERREALVALIENQIDRLARYEYLIGGWGYYDFNAQTQRPSGNSTSFTTATVLIALREAQQAGVAVPEDMVDRGIAALLRQRNPDNTYTYSSNFQNYRGREINRPAGSLGRTQVANVALRMWGEDELITEAMVVEWLDRLFARNGWLSIGRKRPVPHESWYAVAGYFYYYGHLYAGYLIGDLPPELKPFYSDHMSQTLIALQEDDGSWWDYPLYDYHQPYGTAMALIALQNCRNDTLPVPAVADRNVDE
ncbi:MAG: hypothetical protein WD294_15300 [Phycisphaeraceae bacterium]